MDIKIIKSFKKMSYFDGALQSNIIRQIYEISIKIKILATWRT